MKLYVAAMLAVFAFSTTGYTQLAPLPPSSTLDGVTIRDAGSNLAGWSASPLSDYIDSSSDSFSAPQPIPAADAFGRTWTSAAPSLDALFQHGGTLRVILLGGDGSWQGALGYSYAGGPSSADSFTVGDTQSFSFGQYVDICLGAGSASTFDLWATGGPNTFGLLHPEDSQIGTSGFVSWTEDPLAVETFIPSFGSGAYAGIDTWIASVSESTVGANHPEQNYQLALQVFIPTGQPTAFSDPAAVPEPASCGAAAGALLLAGALFRRRLPGRSAPGAGQGHPGTC